jgi:hypothetical protein
MTQAIMNLMTQDLNKNFFLTTTLGLEKKNCWTRFVRLFWVPSNQDKSQVAIAIDGCVNKTEVQVLGIPQRQLLKGNLEELRDKLISKVTGKTKNEIIERMNLAIDRIRIFQ